MLKRITLENFFSFGKKTTIELNPDVNILLGINGSGKSNFLKAIRLLYEAVAGQGLEKTFLDDWGGFYNIANVSGTRTVTFKVSFYFEATYKLFSYELLFRTLSSNTEYVFDELLTTSHYQKNNGEEILLINVNGGNKLHDIAGKVCLSEGELTVLTGNESNVNPSELALRQFAIDDWGISDLLEFIKNINSYNYFDLSSKSVIRQPNSLSAKKYLLSTGENLNTVIQEIKNNDTLEYDKIEKLLEDINPNFKDISFDSKNGLLLREKNLAKTISIEHISDGTLRYLLLLAILYNPKRGSIVCIDEPEMGLHPDMISTIADAIKYSSKTTQMFIATHSPLLLNRFDLEDVLIFEKDKNNKTIVVKKTEEDFKDWDDNYMIGQLWLNGQLGGKRW